MKKRKIVKCPQCNKRSKKLKINYYGSCSGRWCNNCKITFLESAKYSM